MLFIDASALTALIVNEPESSRLATDLAPARERRTSGIALWETAVAVARIKKTDLMAAWDEVERYVSALNIAVVPVDAAEAAAALGAFARYGKRAGHPAQLNMGDCFSYACARIHAAKLLYKGNDFSHTDLA